MGRDEITVSELIEKLKQLPHDMPIMTTVARSQGITTHFLTGKLRLHQCSETLTFIVMAETMYQKKILNGLLTYSNKMDYEQIDINDYSVEKVLVIG